MPEGVVIDSRSSNSPQWGYLKVEDDDKPCNGSMDNHPSEKALMNYKQGSLPWSTHLLFVNNTDKTGGPITADDRVCFTPVIRTVPVNGIPVRFVVAKIIKKI